MYLPSFPQVDMFSAGINALYGVLVARQPSHNRGYTAAGLLIMSRASAHVWPPMMLLLLATTLTETRR